MPVRSTIQVSLVSTRRARSALVTRPAGAAEPGPPNCSPSRVGGVPARRAVGSRATTVTPAAISQRPEPGDGLAFPHPFAVVDQQAHHPPGEARAHRDGAPLAVDVPDDLPGVHHLALGGDDGGL